MYTPVLKIRLTISNKPVSSKVRSRFYPQLGELQCTVRRCNGLCSELLFPQRPMVGRTGFLIYIKRLSNTTILRTLARKFSE
jgi:hypothetical protein